MKLIEFTFNRAFSTDENFFVKNGTYIFQFISDRKLIDIYHSHDFYEVVVVLKGQVIHIVNNHIIKMSKDDFIILRPGDKHAFKEQTDDMVIISFSIKSEEFIRLCSIYSSNFIEKIVSPENPVKLHKNELSSNLNSLFPHMDVKCERNDCKLMLSFILKVYSDKTLKEQNNIDIHSLHKTDEIPKVLLRAMIQMKKPDNLKAGLPAFIELSHYSKTHLSRLMKKHFNMTIHEYILKIRLETAYNNIILSNERIEDIAEKLGYSSLSHFTKIFQNKYGLTPASLRKNHSLWTI